MTIDALDLADGRPCSECGEPVTTLVVWAYTNVFDEECPRGHVQ